ncbi:MAG: TAXI family TRAP transporter solute-binding subunit [Alphaproteobacteria bacterium]|nr:TAXI family TRAP transporter solute-binding subunit [Alphaproteobacteria bacterium]
MKFRSVAALAFASLVGACALPATNGGSPPAVTPTVVTIASGAPGGVYQRIGTALCDALGAQNPPVGCATVATDGSVDNLRALAAGAVGFGLTQADTALAAQLGVGPFYGAGPNRALRSVLALGIEPLAIVVRADSGIARFADLKGRRIDPGASGSGTEITMRGLIASHGWTVGRDVTLIAIAAGGHAEALCAGRVDAIALIGAQPNPAVETAAAGCPAALVSVAGPVIDAVVVGYPTIDKETIAGGTYPWLTTPVATVGLQTILATTEGQPDDAVRAVAAAAAADPARLRRAHLSLRRVTAKSMLVENDVLPLHPAAAAYGEAAAIVAREELLLAK